MKAEGKFTALCDEFEDSQSFDPWMAGALKRDSATQHWIPGMSDAIYWL